MFAKLKWWLFRKFDRCPRRWTYCLDRDCDWYGCCQNGLIVSRPKVKRIPASRVRRVERKPFEIEED